MRKETFEAQIIHVGLSTFFNNARSVEGMRVGEVTAYLNKWYDHHLPDRSEAERFESLVGYILR
jgi:hypothetical protein